jgi:hypothetical protein
MVAKARNLCAGGFARLQQGKFRRNVDFYAVDEDFRHESDRFRGGEWTIYCVAARGRKVRCARGLAENYSQVFLVAIAEQFWRRGSDISR